MPTATASRSVEDAVKRRRGELVELSHAIHAAYDALPGIGHACGHNIIAAAAVGTALALAELAAAAAWTDYQVEESEPPYDDSVHQSAFAAAAAGPSADNAVEGAVMLARAVVGLAETQAERDRVLELLARRTS